MCFVRSDLGVFAFSEGLVGFFPGAVGRRGSLGNCKDYHSLAEVEVHVFKRIHEMLFLN